MTVPSDRKDCTCGTAPEIIVRNGHLATCPAAVPSDRKEAEWETILNAICLDSLEVSFERLVKHRDGGETSDLFVALHVAVTALVAERDAAVAALREARRALVMAPISPRSSSEAYREWMASTNHAAVQTIDAALAVCGSPDSETPGSV